MATKPFTGSSSTLLESKPPPKETESEVPQNRTSKAENSNNQTCTIRGIQIKAEKSKRVGFWNFTNKYGAGGAVGQNKTDHIIEDINIDSKEGEDVGMQKFGNEYNSSKDEARSSSEEEGTSKKPWYKPW
ncbi:hypothetical protein Pyn_22437 [Prunus yedoensis var. nudiflora]|uniref:Uncharacterized protein n=1 Tax=Prunus yedoensis var. nudiflora TaxID=2094558 RepID=A0A314Z905_PRUYE|nr:hypothetical protein Pyn_22437 [Prunus yedoensis var. nudiflora]